MWDLEVLRSNNSSWPISVADVKEGLITVKGHMQVGPGEFHRGTVASFSRPEHGGGDTFDSGFYHQAARRELAKLVVLILYGIERSACLLLMFSRGCSSFLAHRSRCSSEMIVVGSEGLDGPRETGS